MARFFINLKFFKLFWKIAKKIKTREIKGKMKKNYVMPDNLNVRDELEWKRLNYHSDEFRSRADRLKTMEFPPSNNMRIVITANHGGYGFSTSIENLKKFGTRMDPEMAMETVKKASDIVGREYARKKREEVTDRHKWSYRFLKFALFLVLTGFVIFQYPVYVDIEESENVIYGGFLFLFLALIITVGVIVRTIAMERKKETMDEHILRVLGDFAQKENSRLYRQHGIEFSIGPKYFWLEFKLVSA